MTQNASSAITCLRDIPIRSLLPSFLIIFIENKNRLNGIESEKRGMGRGRTVRRSLIALSSYSFVGKIAAEATGDVNIFKKKAPSRSDDLGFVEIKGKEEDHDLKVSNLHGSCQFYFVIL